jgi:hypothetical protein
VQKPQKRLASNADYEAVKRALPFAPPVLEGGGAAPMRAVHTMGVPRHAAAPLSARKVGKSGGHKDALKGEMGGGRAKARVPTEENVAASTDRHLEVHLFVAAVGDGELADDTPVKTREMLEQVQGHLAHKNPPPP